MTNNQNNLNVFKTAIGSVSKIKKWQNFPTGSPQRDSKQEPMKSSINEYNKYWTDHKQELINNMTYELRVLNYQNNPLSEDPKQRACSLYFRGDNNRRLIGGFLILQTLKDLYTSQRQVKEQFDHMSKALISNVFKDAVEAGWFIKKQSLVSTNLFIYNASPTLMAGGFEYYSNVQCSRNRLLQKECCSRNEQRFTK